MKILIIQECGRHQKNKAFRECENFKRAFDKLGIECSIWGLGYDNFKIPFAEISKEHDVFLVLENYDESGWVPDLSLYKQLKLNWIIDCHCGNLIKYIEFSKKSNIHIHLNSSEQYIKYFSGAYQKAFWFPNAYPDDLIDHRPNIQKTIDIGFCGSMIGDRLQWLDLIEKRYGNKLQKDIFVIGDDMINKINSYKIALNKSISDDINYRVFETLGTKTLLITNNVPNIERIFSNHKHCVIYSSIEDLFDQLDYYTNNFQKCCEIAENGYQHVKSSHTYLSRAKSILEIIK